MRLAAEFLGLVKGGGVNVITNVQNNTGNKTLNVGPGFDSVVRQLAEQKKQQFGGMVVEHKPSSIEAPE